MTGTPHQPPTTGRGKKASKETIEQRVSRVYRLLTQNYRRPEIRRVLALEATKEANDRTRALQSGELPPPTVWGDEGSVPNRSLDRYIARARKRMAFEGEKISKRGNFLLGKAIAQMDDLYNKCYLANTPADRRTCNYIIQQQLQLFGLQGAIHLELSGLDGGPVQVQQQAERTLPELSTDLLDLFATVRKRHGLPPLPITGLSLNGNGSAN